MTHLGELAMMAALGYLLGALPFGLLVARVAGNVDLRRHGSGRTGTTNVLRTLGPSPAAAVFILDLAKGLVPVIVARALLSAGGPTLAEWGAAAAGIGAVVGHIYSAFIGFRGGRGVATTIGALLALAPLAVAIIAPPVLAIMWRSRYVSLGSICGAVLAPLVVTPLAVLSLVSPPAVVYAAVAGVLVLVAHRDNVGRLLAGTERKIGQREKIGSDA